MLFTAVPTTCPRNDGKLGHGTIYMVCPQCPSIPFYVSAVVSVSLFERGYSPLCGWLLLRGQLIKSALRAPPDIFPSLALDFSLSRSLKLPMKYISFSFFPPPRPMFYRCGTTSAGCSFAGPMMVSTGQHGVRKTTQCPQDILLIELVHPDGAQKFWAPLMR